MIHDDNPTTSPCHDTSNMPTRHNVSVAPPYLLTPHPPNTTTHNPRKQARRLIFRWFYFSLTPPQPTTPENEHEGLFLGVWPFHGYHHPPENEPLCSFLGGLTFPWQPPLTQNPPKMSVKPHFHHSFSIKYIIRSNKYIENTVPFHSIRAAPWFVTRRPKFWFRSPPNLGMTNHLKCAAGPKIYLIWMRINENFRTTWIFPVTTVIFCEIRRHRDAWHPNWTKWYSIIDFI